jgi:ABC-type transport system substrate-binding protein
MRLLVDIFLLFALLVGACLTQDIPMTESGQLQIELKPTNFKREPTLTTTISSSTSSTTTDVTTTTKMATNPVGGGSRCPQMCLAKAAASSGCGS